MMPLPASPTTGKPAVPEVVQRKFAIAIPTYNERENVRELISQLNARLPSVRIFVVDDNSPDGTSGVVEELQKTMPGIELLWRPRKNGLASAYFHAFHRIVSDESVQYIVTMDADLSHGTDDLVRLITSVEHYDLIVGSRYIAGGEIKHWQRWRWALSRFGNLYAGFITNIPITDVTAGFVIYSRDLLKMLLRDGIRSEGYSFQIEMKYLAHRLGAKIKEVPISFVDRSRGRSKLGKSTVVEGVFMPWYLRLFR